MNFWDSSALVALLVSEPASDRLLREIDDPGSVMVWWGTIVECASALARMRRAGDLDPAGFIEAKDRLSATAAVWSEVPPSETLRDKARDLLADYPLRAADSLQLAAALIGADGYPSELTFVCLDQRLCDAARQEGFTILP